MLKSVINFFIAKCDMIPEADPQNQGKKDGDFPDDDEEEEYYALDMYPERRGSTYKPSWAKRVFLGAGKQVRLKMSCQVAIQKAINRNPIIRLLLNALESSGCEVDIPRLFQCEICHYTVCGGYDADFNQVVICYNTTRLQSSIEAVMIHELIHVFDHCRNDISFRNHEHVACTEIRALNLLHSTFMSCLMEGNASLFDFKGRHKECVRARAIKTMITSRKLPTAEAIRIVDKVFDRCYADLEPFGRRVTDNYKACMAENEGKYFGY